MFYVRVPAGEGRAARQLRTVLVDTTKAVPGDTVVLQANGRWAPSSANGGVPADIGVAVADLRARLSAAESALAQARARVTTLEENQTIVEVGSDVQGWTRVERLRIDVETGDLLIGEED